MAQPTSSRRRRLRNWGLTCLFVAFMHLISIGLWFMLVVGVLAAGAIAGPGDGPTPRWEENQELRNGRSDNDSDQGSFWTAGYTFSKNFVDQHLAPTLPPLPQLPTTNDPAASQDFEVKRAAYQRIEDDRNCLNGLCWLFDSLFFGVVVGTPLYWWFYWVNRYEECP